MTIKELKEIIATLPDSTIVLIEETDVTDVESISIQYHAGGRVHLIFSTLE